MIVSYRVVIMKISLTLVSLDRWQEIRSTMRTLVGARLELIHNKLLKLTTFKKKWLNQQAWIKSQHSITLGISSKVSITLKRKLKTNTTLASLTNIVRLSRSLSQTTTKKTSNVKSKTKNSKPNTCGKKQFKSNDKSSCKMSKKK